MVPRILEKPKDSIIIICFTIWYIHTVHSYRMDIGSHYTNTYTPIVTNAFHILQCTMKANGIMIAEGSEPHSCATFF